MPPLASRSGVVRHSNRLIALAEALDRVPKTERVEVMLEHDETGVCRRTTINRIAVCVVLRKGSLSYGIYETLDRAKKEGFGIVTRHPSLGTHQFVFVSTKPPTPPVEEGP